MTETPLAARDRRATAAATARALGAALLVLLLTVAAAAVVSALTGCAAEEPTDDRDAAGVAASDADGAIVVASALCSEPYEQATSTNQIGFTVELLRLIGEKSGREIRFTKAVNHKDAEQNITAGLPEDVARPRLPRAKPVSGLPPSRRPTPLKELSSATLTCMPISRC